MGEKNENMEAGENPSNVEVGVPPIEGIELSEQDKKLARELEFRSQNPDKEPLRLVYKPVVKKSASGKEYIHYEKHWVKNVIIKQKIE